MMKIFQCKFLKNNFSELLDRAVSSDNAKDYYMKVSLMKKYFRLACKLLKYKTCKNYLNTPKPPDDNEDYIFIMNKFQLLEKQKNYEKLEKEGLNDIAELDENLLKLLTHNTQTKTEEHDTKEKGKVTVTILEEPGENIMKKKFQTINDNENSKSTENQIEAFTNFHLNDESADISDNFESNTKLIMINKNNSLESSEKTSFIKDDSKIKLISESEFDNRSLFNPFKKSEKNNAIEGIKINQALEMVNFVNRHRSQKLSLPEINIDKPEGIADNQLNLKREAYTTNFPLTNLQFKNSSIASERENSVRKQISKEKGQAEEIKTSGRQEKNSSSRGNKIAFTFNDLLDSTTLINVQSVLIDHLRWGQYTFNCICLLSSISDRYLNTEYSDKICKSLMVFSRDEEAISRCRSPLILCVLAAEFLIKLGKLNTKYQYKCQSIAEIFLKLGECLQSAMKDEEMLNYYLREQIDHKKRSALEIIAENRFYDMLNNENVATIVGKLWYGTGRDRSVFKFCRISRIVLANIKHENYIDLTSNDIKDKQYSFQFSEYTNNCSVRYLVDSMSTIMTTILFQVIIYFYVSLGNEDNDRYSNLFFLNLTYIANIIVFTINLNLIMYMLYVYLANRTLKISLFILVDIIMFLGVFCNFIKLPYALFNEKEDLEKIELFDAIIYSIVIICAWMRVIGILTTTRSFGPFLRIIYLLLSTLINFLLVFFSITTVFAQVFTILFRNTNSDFKGFFSSWISLFNSSFGIQNFENFTIMKVFGYSLLMIYTTGTNVVLLNLVVAIINNLFHFFEKKADAENRAVLVLSYERIKWDEEYGLLILLPAPFNIISFIFSMFLIFSKDRHKKHLNEVFSKICYFIIAFGNFLILIICSIILFPFAYIKSLIHSGYDNLGKFSIKNLRYIIFHIFTRPFVFLYYIFEDIKNFWKICYKDNKFENKENRKNLINRSVIMKIRKVLFNYRFDQKKNLISVDELYSRLRLNKKSIYNKFTNIKMDSSFDGGSESDNSIYNSENEGVEEFKQSNTDESQVSLNYGNTNESMKTKSKDSFVTNNTTSELTEPEKILSYKYIIDKIVDKDRFINIERTLFILPSRVKYTDHFIKTINFLNMRVVLSGLQKFLFVNANNNAIYSYKKLQQLIYKIIIKLKMVYFFLPVNQMNKIKTDFKAVNLDEKYSKSYENLFKMEQNDEFSDYDDQGIFEELNRLTVNNPKTYQQNNSNSNNVSDESQNASIVGV